MVATSITLTALTDLPEVRPGDDLAALITSAIERQEIVPRDLDIFVVSQKIVSKAEGRYVDLATVEPGPRAREVAEVTEKDPRIVEVILSEAQDIVRCAKGTLIVRHRLGWVMANAGVDRSNLEPAEGGERVLLLPCDPDAVCRGLHDRLEQHFGVRLGIVMCDSFGRPWRIGVVGVAIGAAGLPAVQSLIGEPDLHGRALQATEVGMADQIASAASLLMGQAAESIPLVLVRGLIWHGEGRGAFELVRPAHADLFR